MHISRFSSAESRLLNAYIDPDKVKKVSTRGQIVNVAPTKTTSQGTPLPTGAPTSTFVSNGKTVNSYDTPLPSAPQGNLSAGSSNYNINLDPTYSGMIGAETGYTGDPLTAGNVGPSKGQSWSGGEMRSDGTMAGGSNADPFKSLATQADEYARSQNPIPNPATPGYAEAMVAYNQALQASKAEFIGRKQIEQQQQQQSSQRSQNAMVSDAVGQDINAKQQEVTTAQQPLGAAGLTRRLNNMTSRQDFIQQQRDLGKTDLEIREMIRTMPPEQTGSSIQMQTSVPIPPDATTPQPASSSSGAGTPIQTAQAPTATPTPEPTPQQTSGGNSAVSGQPAPVIPPVASSIGEQMYQVALANGDPMAGITKALYDDLVAKEAEARNNALISLGGAIAGAEQENTDTQSFIDKWMGIATKNSNNLTNLLQTQNEETNKVLEQQKSNALQKLEFDKQVAVQKAEKQKADEVLRSSIAIGLRGGAYSGAAQNALADAERTWDTNIMNLSKEFSFKAADVVTDFTSKYVTAKQNLALNLFNASESLTAKTEGYANAGFTSLQAKKNAINSAKSEYRKTVDKITEDHSKDVKELAKGISDRLAEQAKANQKDSMSTKDKLGFVSGLRSGIGQNKIITLAKDVDGFYGAFNAGYSEYKSLLEDIAAGRMKEGDVSLNPSQSGAIGSLARMFDPGSVVRNEEYERQVLGQAAPAIISGWYQKLKAGGTGLTPNDLAAMKRTADKLHDAWETKLSNEMQPFILDIQDWNANYPEAPIRYEQVIPVDRVHLPSQTFSTWEQQSQGAYNTSGTENTSGSSGWLSSDKAPANGYRTDRHNNPTAFTVDVAKQAGLVEGVDYEVDTALQNGFPTAKLLGDPFEKTIEVIDKIGFYTKSGAPRWTHTAIPQMEWQSMNNEQKKSFVVSMYQKEGGTGVLAQGIDLPEGSTERKTYSLVPSAQAESPDDIITFTDEPEPSPLVSGSALSVQGTGANPSLAYKVAGRFRNKKTGEEISVASANDIAFYKERPSAYEDLTAPKTKTTTTKPLSLGDKPLPS